MKNSKIIIIILLICTAFMLGLFVGRMNSGKSIDVFLEDKEENTGRIDINTATLDELCLLPGISDATATKIIEYRDENGRFRYAEELCKIPGISTEKLEEFIDFITID